jgi:hypothetical protein
MANKVKRKRVRGQKKEVQGQDKEVARFDKRGGEARLEKEFSKSKV